jgi:hypothetical protein
VILSPYDVKREPPRRLAESSSVYAPAGPARDTIHVVVRRSAGFEGRALRFISEQDLHPRF